jgi:DNA invertase Pin-like site-specific DNA recombinase
MTPLPKIRRCAIYTRKSTEHGLEQEFNSLDAQREAAEAYVKSQAHEGWRLCPERYDDGGLSGGTLERPALQTLLAAVVQGRIDIIVVYKVDRLTRSLADFAKLVELFDKHGVSFVAVTQQFNTTNSMGRLTLNVLLSFAQFEREVTGERIRDKIAASKKKGLWMGGPAPFGYRVEGKKLVVDPIEAEQIRTIFRRYLELESLTAFDEGPRHTRGRDQEAAPGLWRGPQRHPPPTSSETACTWARSPIGAGSIRESCRPLLTATSSRPFRRSSPARPRRAGKGGPDRMRSSWAASSMIAETA